MIIKQILFILFALNIFVNGQVSEKIKQKNIELDKINKQIEVLEQKLESKTDQEKKSYKIIQTIDEQILLLTKLLNEIKEEEYLLKLNINNKELEIKDVEEEVKRLQSNYSEYIVWLYKHPNENWLKQLFKAGSMNQFLIRYKYLEVISNSAKASKSKLEEQKGVLSTKKEEFLSSLKFKEQLYRKKLTEQEKLVQRKNERIAIIENIKKDQAQITAEIEEKRKAEVEIKNIVAKLFEEQRRMQAKIESDKMKGEKIVGFDYNYNNFENFARLKGRLNWPVKSGNISRNFGENENKKLKTITLNYGIDIDTKKNAKAFAVAEGIVSAIDWIPGFGSVLILTHKNEYRTVYGHITDFEVREGDKVKGGTVLGRVNETLEGSIIHFEIWNERNYQNPTEWLVKK